MLLYIQIAGCYWLIDAIEISTGSLGEGGEVNGRRYPRRWKQLGSAGDDGVES